MDQCQFHGPSIGDQSIQTTTTFVRLGTVCAIFAQHPTWNLYVWVGKGTRLRPPADVYRNVCRRVLCRADGVDGHAGLLFPSRRAVGGSAGMT